MKRSKTWFVVGAIGVVAAVWAAGCGSGSGNGTDGGGVETGPQCGTNATLCGGSCATLASDNANCGACGTVCSSGQVCSKGACATSCGGGTSLCGSTCNDTQTDPNNCGACGTKCAGGQVCSSGKCAATCATSETLCGSSCVDTQTDNANCGSCNDVCQAGEACAGGTCSLTCQQGLSLCQAPTITDGGVTDAANEASTDAALLDSSTDAALDSGFVLTYPYCANFQSDNQNCGGCGIVCGGGTTCKGGSCVNDCTGQDGGALTLCAPDGGASYCADTTVDNTNCGTCGHVCPNGQLCSNGACVASFALAGSFAVSSGLTWTSNPPIVTCQQECANLFGGTASNYVCSTSNTTVTHTAWESCWGDGTHCFGGTAVADNYSVGTMDDCGSLDCYCSAYVSDHCSSNSVNYCWK